MSTINSRLLMSIPSLSENTFIGALGELFSLIEKRSFLSFWPRSVFMWPSLFIHGYLAKEISPKCQV